MALATRFLELPQSPLFMPRGMMSKFSFCGCRVGGLHSMKGPYGLSTNTLHGMGAGTLPRNDTLAVMSRAITTVVAWGSSEPCPARRMARKNARVDRTYSRAQAKSQRKAVVVALVVGHAPEKTHNSGSSGFTGKVSAEIANSRAPGP